MNSFILCDMSSFSFVSSSNHSNMISKSEVLRELCNGELNIVRDFLWVGFENDELFSLDLNYNSSQVLQLSIVHDNLVSSRKLGLSSVELF